MENYQKRLNPNFPSADSVPGALQRLLRASRSLGLKEIPMTEKARVTILYCTQCNWLLRAAWMAQELLQTFTDSLGEVALIPGTGGNFEIRVNGDLIWERKRDGGFPGPKELKQRVRDIIEPDRDLGHTDRASLES